MPVITKPNVSNNFYFDGKNYQDGVHYSCLDYVPVSGFTPLSGTNWWRVNNIIGKPVIKNNIIDIDVGCIRCDNPSMTKTKKLRIEVISYDRNIFRVRFNQYTSDFGEYDQKENVYGPITRNQLNWIQQQNTKSPDISYNGNELIIKLKDVIMTFYNSCYMIIRNYNGDIIHQDGWVTPPNISGDSKPQGIVFVDEEYGSAAALIKTLPEDKNGDIPNYYGCSECQNYYKTYDAKGDHSSSLDHKYQTTTYFNYDNYGMNQTELKPNNENPDESNAEQPFIPEYMTAPFFIEYPNDLSYAYGMLLDNTSQSYANFGNIEFSGAIDPQHTQNIDKVYYVGAQYPELDYYLIFPSDDSNEKGLIGSVIDNYSILTGKESEQKSKLNLRGAMPPKYIFGFFQGVYGFTGVDSGNWSVKSVVDGYKNNNIPLEGLAIDVDVQNNFEIFTTNKDFWTGGAIGSGQSVFDWAHDQDLVCHTNITNFIRNDQENYGVYDSLKEQKLNTETSKFVDFENRSEGQEYIGILPYTGTTATFPHFGNPNTPSWWGKNYWDDSQTKCPSLLNIGLDFVWQDMTNPDMGPHILGNSVYNQNYDGTPGSSDLTSGKFNWKSYHGQQLYGDPRYPGNEIPYIALRNLHAYMECKSTYEYGLTNSEHYPKKYQRSYIISRGGYIGLAHYGGLWTGDNASGWKYMQIELPKILNLGLCGVPIAGTDIGGFAPDESEDFNHCQENLMVRWIQSASLLPWFRDHYANTNHNGKSFQEIYNFNWDYNGRKYSDIMNDFVKMRVRFHHVLYSSMYKFCQTGLPIVKPTCLYEGGSQSKDIMKGFVDCQDSQYFIGDYSIMVAPAMEDQNCGDLPAQSSADRYPTTIQNHPIWIPNDKKWFPYDAATDGPCNPNNQFSATQGEFTYCQGDGDVHYYTVPLEKMPVFIKEGAIIPTRQTKDGSIKNIQQLDKDDEPFVFDIWPGSQKSEYQCYFDDAGKTRSAELNDNYTLLNVSQNVDNNWNISLSYDYQKYALTNFLYFRLRGAVNGNVSDNKNNKYMAANSLSDLYNQNLNQYFYDESNKEMWIKISTNNLIGLVISKTGTYSIKCL